jgi:putative pyruvate formate lyase activating enzyme
MLKEFAKDKYLYLITWEDNMLKKLENYPSYLSLFRSGELTDRSAKAREMLSPCRLCPRECQAARLQGEKGACEGGALAKVASFSPHFGEESPLVGYRGSGTIFFSYCPLHCVFCQNWDISQSGAGREVEPEALANMMLQLQKLGCHNINFVTPTHFVPYILEALILACDAGLDIPLVYNSAGYDALESLRLLDSVMDIYMPDIKYAGTETGNRLSDVDNYPAVAKAALKEMQRQVGDLIVDDRGIALKGLIIRHLVLPRNMAGTKEVLRFIASEISQDAYVNIMDQYRPEYHAVEVEGLRRRLSQEEYREALSYAREVGLRRLDVVMPSSD